MSRILPRIYGKSLEFIDAGSLGCYGTGPTAAAEG